MRKCFLKFDQQEFYVDVTDVTLEHCMDMGMTIYIHGTVHNSTDSMIRRYLLNKLNGVSTPNQINVTKVVYNNPATVVYWDDGTKTVVKCQTGDQFNEELGFLMAVAKKSCGNKSNFNELLKKHVPGYGKKEPKVEHRTEPTVNKMREELADFCHKRTCCVGCPMYKNGFECGRGKFFTYDIDDRAYMTDESIIKHYKTMKGAEEDGHE